MKNQIIKDAFWQILGRVFSALGGFITIKLITPFLWPLRYGDYNTVLKYFAIRSALADLGLYAIALREIGKLKEELLGRNKKQEKRNKEEVQIGIEWGEAWDLALEIVWAETNAELDPEWKKKLSEYYSKFMWSRILNLVIVYGIALAIGYMIPGYNQNPFIVRGLPLGLMFSATFVLGYFFQLPHQLFRSMQHTSISLIIARIGQIILLCILLYLFPNVELVDATPQNILIFCLILGTVIVSWVLQIAWQRRTGRKYLTLSWNIDYTFFWNHIKNNWKYGVGYFMSSFHTLAVGMLLSRMYPTVNGWIYVWVRGLAMTLIEILLIVPSALGNSMLHKVSSKSLEEQKSSFGNLLVLVCSIGMVIAANFVLFHTEIIRLVSGPKYLTSTLGQIGSDYILIFLGFVLLMTFIKQVYNYIFVATDNQNELFKINSLGVILGIGCGIFLVKYYGLVGWIITQVRVELLYMLGGFWIARKKWVLPRVDWKQFGLIIGLVCLCALLWWWGSSYVNMSQNRMIGVLIIWLWNIIIGALLFFPLKKIVKGM